MSYIKADNDKEQKHFDFLERLRQSGVTNMFGAAPYLRKAYPKDFAKPTGFHAGDVVAKWMNGHSDPTRVLDGPAPKKAKKTKETANA